MFWLLTHLLPPLTSESYLAISIFLCVTVKLTDGRGERGEGGGGAKSYDGEKNLVIYKTFNTLWYAIHIYVQCTYKGGYRQGLDQN
jgi:hypothetical protein